ncbi:bifunctional 2-C-methyl-D-erythritol 4-phosphate cytidylyltransferase/2-C-methyl-D-erythritol 2,4-cyclodiphosphate synthase [Pseudooceanicola aestuarii]|uniref:bifunctional 2-C-methyl-D-erythritol 4-phosphate cytidylyltransferase/2-C-methyl-D-erythritol 2,4-cyclodiphosphate synthase n=1 Tax=Pseudooceanicola aestuarii TaxID=2697319 RepID=UPI0013CF6863|nr:bifunctional 2-C-methyl-D-erythritol 4-phosphate cytidylyltransferase/2-C-methyl-D-erythritol 2,4-cyclodiphosphate synthase [Pseudooceanicola aestuarii]
MNDAAIIVAAGRGLRAGGDLPKQWQPLAGRRVADWTLAAILEAGLSPVVLVLHPDDMEMPGLPAAVERVAGGATRGASVRAGLAALAGRGVDRVLIHDVARPCVDRAVIDAVRAALNDAPAAAPGLPVTDALWQGSDRPDAGDNITGCHVTAIRARDGLFRAQTPQGFHLAAITAAHQAAAARADAAADDVAVALAAGLDIAITPGNEDNLKITWPGDHARAEAILRRKETQMDVRLGNGFDVHAFCEGDHVVLCGVHVPHGRGLTGHSDADVGLHAITDAIYGALADGDIGQHFPPSDPQWKGAASDIFLRHAARRAAERGYAIANVDCTLICEAPRIGPHAGAMRAVVAACLDIDVSRVSVKATTTEQLGFAGRREGIAALATATLIAAPHRPEDRA